MVTVQTHALAHHMAEMVYNVNCMYLTMCVFVWRVCTCKGNSLCVFVWHVCTCKGNSLCSCGVCVRARATACVRLDACVCMCAQAHAARAWSCCPATLGRDMTTLVGRGACGCGVRDVASCMAYLATICAIRLKELVPTTAPSGSWESDV